MDKLTIIPMLPVWLLMVVAHKALAKNGDPLADLPALAAAIRTR